MISGREAASAFIPSCASRHVTGFMFLEYRASTVHDQCPIGFRIARRAQPAWAIAFIPLVALNPEGRVMVKLTSYITVPGSIFGSFLDTFRPWAVSPRFGVISLPA